MTEHFTFILNVIYVDVFTAFGLYTLLYLLIRVASARPFFKKADEEITNFVSFAGLVYFVVWIAAIAITLSTSSEPELIQITGRLFGKYWFGFWLQPLFWIALTQVLRLETVRTNVILRLLTVFFLMFSFEKLIIAISSFHDDYLPSSWTMCHEADIYPENIVLNVIIKLCLLFATAYLFYLSKKGLKMLTFK